MYSLEDKFHVLKEDILENLEEKELELINKLSTLRSPPEKEWEDYLCYGGFPISIHLNEFDIHRKTYEMIQRIIEKDINHYRSFRKDTTRVIFRILTFLALQKPGELSEANKRYKSNYGILVSNRSQIIEKEGNMIQIPLTTFSFI